MLNHQVSRYLALAVSTLLTSASGCISDFEAPEATGTVDQETFMGDLGEALGSPVVTGHTSGLTNDYTPTCIPSSTAPDASYTWTAPATASYQFTTAGSTFDTVLEIRAANTNLSMGCNDDSNGTLQSSVTVNVAAGQTVMIVIDGFGSATGQYRLNISSLGGGGVQIPTLGLHLWLRSDAGLSAPHGGRVPQWLDQSGNGRHATMGTTARQPFHFTGALNGHGVVRFFGAESLSLSILSQPTHFSVFVVGKNNKTTESFSMILGPGGNSPNNQLRWENGSQALFVGTGNNFPIIRSSIGNTRTYHALSARYNGSTMSVYRDGGLRSSHNFVTSGPWILASVGSWYSSEFMQGDLAEVVVYDRALSENERLSVNAYLRSKYNLP
jgi:hypothetical protein